MHYVGIDVAKHVHVAAAVDENGKTIAQAFTFDSTRKGFAHLLMTLGNAGVHRDECIIGMEATGHYWITLFDFLILHGFEPVVINPIQTDAFRRVETVRLTKTDAVDAVLIANLLRVKRFEATQAGDEAMESLKQLTRYRMTVVSESTRLKNKTTAILDRIFPEYSSLFPNPYNQASRAILLRCTTPAQTVHLGVVRIERLLVESSNGRYGRKKAEQLYEVAKNSIGSELSSEALAFEARMMLERLALLDMQLKELDAEIAQRLEETPGRWLATIPGIGSTLAAQLAGEIGDPHRFSSSKKLVAYAGIDAAISQSGDSSDSSHVSKRGSAQLRHALMRAADGARRFDPYFKEYYEKKIDEGFPYFKAITCVARKLAGVSLVLMKENRAYTELPPAHHLPNHLQEETPRETAMQQSEQTLLLA